MRIVQFSRYVELPLEAMRLFFDCADELAVNMVGGGGGVVFCRRVGPLLIRIPAQQSRNI